MVALPGQSRSLTRGAFGDAEATTGWSHELVGPAPIVGISRWQRSESHYRHATRENADTDETVRPAHNPKVALQLGIVTSIAASQRARDTVAAGSVRPKCLRDQGSHHSRPRGRCGSPSCLSGSRERGRHPQATLAVAGRRGVGHGIGEIGRAHLPNRPVRPMSPFELDVSGWLPHEFDCRMGGFMGRSYAVRITGAALTYESFKSGYETDEKARIEPPQCNWEHFWATLDQLDAWSWSGQYSNPNVLDGTSWSIALEWNGRRMRASGENAYPPDGRDESPQFRGFCEAVQRLLGGESSADSATTTAPARAATPLSFRRRSR